MTDSQASITERIWLFGAIAVIVSCVLAIAWMMLAALAFSQAVDVNIPFLWRSHGYVESGGSHAVEFSGSWMGFWVLVLALSLLAHRGVSGMTGRFVSRCSADGHARLAR